MLYLVALTPFSVIPLVVPSLHVHFSSGYQGTGGGKNSYSRSWLPVSTPTMSGGGSELASSSLHLRERKLFFQKPPDDVPSHLNSVNHHKVHPGSFPVYRLAQAWVETPILAAQETGQPLDNETHPRHLCPLSSLRLLAESITESLCHIRFFKIRKHF